MALIRRYFPVFLAILACTLRAGGGEVILLDFGDVRSNDSIANNFTDPLKRGLLASCTVTTSGRLTPVRLRQIAPWDGKVSFKKQDSPLNADGFLLAGKGHHAKIDIERLMPRQEYKIDIIAGDGGSMRVSIRNKTVYLNPKRKPRATISITPTPNGIISLVFKAKEAKAVLCGIRIEGETPPLYPKTALPESPGDPPIVQSKSWLIVDVNEEKILAEKAADEPREIASLTKTMTALVVMRLIASGTISPNDEVVVSKRASRTEGRSAMLRKGDRMPLKALLHAMLLRSGNDAATAVAEHCGRILRKKDVEDPLLVFVRYMNKAARRMNLTHTHFTTPSGLGHNVSTAREVASFTLQAMKYGMFREIVGTYLFRQPVKTADGGIRVMLWKNTNKLLIFREFTGVKTGYTRKAGKCLTASADIDGRHILIVLLGGIPSSRPDGGVFADARNLLTWIRGRKFIPWRAGSNR